MPRFALLTGTPHGASAPVVIADAATPLHEQRTAFKDLVRPGSHPDYREVQLWTSDSGIVMRRKLSVPRPVTPQPDPDAEAKAKILADEAQAKADAEAKAKADAEAQAKAESDAGAKAKADADAKAAKAKAKAKS